MASPIRNQVLEAIKQKESLTDKELEKLLAKDGTKITESEFNKVLLDLEIMGLISVSWVTKYNRRVEAITEKIEEDEYEEQIKEPVYTESDYEVMFRQHRNFLLAISFSKSNEDFKKRFWLQTS